MDLTSVPKTGKTLPYVRSYNRVFGLHLMTLHLCCGLSRVGCCSQLGVNRWVILSFLAYTLASSARQEATPTGTSLIEAAR